LRNLQNQFYINVTDAQNNQSQCTDLESQGWFKEMEFAGIFGKETFYEPVKGQPTKLKAYQSYVYRRYLLKAGTCQHCRDLLDLNIIKESGCRVRKNLSPKTGAYLRCFTSTKNGDITQHYMNWSDEKHWKLLEEKPVSTAESIQLFKDGKLSFIASWDLITAIEEMLGVNI
jgi:hypothetical protein